MKNADRWMISFSSRKTKAVIENGSLIQYIGTLTAFALMINATTWIDIDVSETYFKIKIKFLSEQVWKIFQE